MLGTRLILGTNIAVAYKLFNLRDHLRPKETMFNSHGSPFDAKMTRKWSTMNALQN